MAPVTCFVRYELKVERLKEFEAYARGWMEAIPRFGGLMHGYFLPSEGASDIAYMLFSFPSLAAYEVYREQSTTDPELAHLWRQVPDLVHRAERSFLRPLLPGDPYGEQS